LKRKEIIRAVILMRMGRQQRVEKRSFPQHAANPLHQLEMEMKRIVVCGLSWAGQRSSVDTAGALQMAAADALVGRLVLSVTLAAHPRCCFSKAHKSFEHDSPLNLGIIF
jgi:hypothetical protein